ncbi:MAG TPA: hypothetical protein VKB80_07940 [Kofleriaceae bacterium]|nr:hypothetical protein [Kofleriaceae bacterium]
MRAVCLVAGAAAGAAAASAHVAPSDRENNRYLLVAPLGDRVRVAYTVYMGQEPGRKARARMDANRDGRIGEREAQDFGDQLAAQVAPRLSLEVDGRPIAVSWQDVDVGLGQPVTDAGAFAVDLVAWICLERPRERLAHRVRLRDGFHLPDPGESELHAEESPGVRITHSTLGPIRSSAVHLDYRWMGGPGLAETDGYRLEFTVDPAVATFAGSECIGGGEAAPPGRVPRGLVAAAAAAGAAVVAAALWLARRRRGRRT